MSDCLDIRRTAGVAAAGFKQPRGCGEWLTCFGKVMGKNFRLSTTLVRRAILKRCCDSAVQSLARPAQQCAISGILYQRVLELVDRCGRRAALKHQAGGHEL